MPGQDSAKHRGLRRYGILSAAIIVAFAGAAMAMAARVAPAWVPTWTAAMQPPFPRKPERFEDETVRLFVRTSVGGERVRLVLSNRFGKTPLRIGALRIARAGDDLRIAPATDRRVTFGGQGATTIAPGRTATSDPIDLSVPSGTRLAVSIYFPERTPVSTTHVLALQTGLVARGNRVADFPITPDRSISDRPFLAAVEVTGDPARAVYVLGDSGVDGDGSTEESDHRWTDYLAAHYSGGDRGRPVAVLNLGLIGNRMLRDSPGVAPYFTSLGEAALRRFDREVPAAARGSCLVVRLGLNDIGFGGIYPAGSRPVAARELIAGYRALVLAAHRRGMRVVGTTITPFEGDETPGYYTPAKDRVREQVNRWMRSAGAFDGLADLDRVLRDPDHPSRLLPRYDSGDHLHVNDQGYKVSAEATDLSRCLAG